MSTIRKQSIVASFVVYAGFAIGFLNTYLLTRQGGFTKEQYGLISVFTAAAIMMYGIANLGMPAVIHKFYPYYRAHLPPQKNDLLPRAILLTLLGFLPVLLLGIVFKDSIISRIFENSRELLHYFFWLFPFGLGYTIFMVLEAYAWQLRMAVLTNLLREVLFRSFTTILILLTVIGIIHTFSLFIGLFAFTYLAIVFIMIAYLSAKGQLHFTLQPSIVTKRFRKKIKALVGFVWGGGLIINFVSAIDTIFVAAILPNGMGAAGVFTFGQYITSLIQAPQRAVIAASLGPLSTAWREKDYPNINRIYQRSSINQLLFACAVFTLIWLNFEDAITTFRLQPEYHAARWVFFFIGLTKIVDMGSGVNAQIIATSTRWRFDFNTGLVLLALSLPLNFFLTREMGITGPAVATLISYSVYNAIRFYFLYKTFRMQPFDKKTVYTLLLTVACFLLAYFPFRHQTGLLWLTLRTLTFLLPFVFITIRLNLSPDALPVWQTVKKRLGLA